MKTRKKVINALEKNSTNRNVCIHFCKSVFIYGWYRFMNELIRDKLRRLKGLPTKRVSTEGIVILDDDKAEAALRFELSKLDEFQKKVNKDYEKKTN
jgi:hypothetical protein